MILLALNLEAMVLWEGTLYVSDISVKINLVDPFMLFFRLLMDAILAPVIIMVMDVTNF